MSTTIIFGTKRLGQAAEAVSKEKYPNMAVVTVEGQKGAKKSRRVLLNSTAATLLNCEIGSIQNLVFASVEMGADAPKQVLIANADIMTDEVDVTYKTSKNKVAYDDSNEKGKAITSSHACSEIFKFLGLDDSANVEFQLVSYPSDAIEAFSLSSIPEASIETNNDTITVEDVVHDTIAEVKAAEESVGEQNSLETLETDIQEALEALETPETSESDVQEAFEALETPVTPVSVGSDWD